MVVDIAAGYIANALLQNLVIPEIAKRLAGKAGEKGAKLKDIEKPKWLQKIGQWLDDHPVGTPEKVEKIINEHQEEIVRELTEHKGELSDLGQQIFDAVNELKERIDDAQLTDEDKAFLAEVKESFNPDEFEKRLEKILKKNVDVDSQKIHDELTIFFDNMGWDDKLDVIDSKVDLVLQSIEDVKVGIKDVKVGIVDLGGKIEELEKPSGIEIQYHPETTPDVPEFVDRETHLDDLRNTLAKKNTIVIQGIAGIGKTQLAAKLQQNIKDEYITFWKKLRDVDTFDSVSRTLAGFLRKNGDPELAEYIEGGTTDHDIVLNILLRSLENKNYVLFFDNYHVVENKEIHDLFKQFKDRLKGSTIVITTRNPPPFVSPIDRVKKKITEESIEGFDLDSTKEYLEQMGVDVSPEQLSEIDKRMRGHPASLSMFVSLADEMAVEEILENLPETDIWDYLYEEIYERLKKDEKRVLKAMSVFRTPVTSEACVYVAQGEDVKDTLRSLKKKLLVKQNEKLYYLHDLVRDFSYSRIDDPKEYHRLAGKYYAQLEKTPENILETTYHMIKDTSVVNDEVVKYLIGTTKDQYTSFIVLEILKENEITSSDVFVLLNEFVNTSDLTIQKMFVIGYGDFFEKIWSINPEKSIDILKQILNCADSKLLVMLSRTLAKIAHKFPDEACDLWRDIIDKGDIDMREFVSFDIVDSKVNSKKAAPVLKYLVRRNEELGSGISPKESWYAKSALENWGFLETKIMTCEDHLEKLKKMSMDEKLLYIKQIKDIFPHPAFVIEILNNVYSQNPYQVTEVLKILIEIYYKYNTTVHQIAKLVSKLARIDIEYLKVFLNEYADDDYIKFVGVRALDIIKYELGEEKTFALLTPILADKSPMIRELASIMIEEMKTSSHDMASSKEKICVDLKSRLNMLKPRFIINIFEAELSRTDPLMLLMGSWGLLKAVEGTDPDIILKILKPLNKYDNAVTRRICGFCITTIQKNPSRILKIAGLALKLSMAHKVVSIWVICNVGNRVPQKAIKYLEPLLTNAEDPVFCINLLSHLMDLRDTLPDETKMIFEKLSIHPNGDVSGLAKLLLKGI